mgnify:CR=1 FL=1
MHVLARRFHPGDDLRRSLQLWMKEEAIAAGWIMSGIGSLQQAALRFAHQPEPTVLKGYFEILSLSGTVSQDGLHLHGAIANEQGEVLGGHICKGCLVYTTAELVIGVTDQLRFTRQPDPQTGFLELQIAETDEITS